jgi:hypothetical protein
MISEAQRLAITQALVADLAGGYDEQSCRTWLEEQGFAIYEAWAVDTDGDPHAIISCVRGRQTVNCYGDDVAMALMYAVRSQHPHRPELQGLPTPSAEMPAWYPKPQAKTKRPKPRPKRLKPSERRKALKR